LCNGRKGLVLVAKRLDCFLILKDLAEGSYTLKTKVLVGGILDHMSISFEVASKGLKPPPFKLNQRWVKEENYKKLIQSIWKPIEDNVEKSHIEQFVENMDRVKKESIIWAKKHNEHAKAMLSNVALSTQHTLKILEILGYHFTPFSPLDFDGPDHCLC